MSKLTHGVMPLHITVITPNSLNNLFNDFTLFLSTIDRFTEFVVSFTCFNKF